MSPVVECSGEIMGEAFPPGGGAGRGAFALRDEAAVQRLRSPEPLLPELRVRGRQQLFPAGGVKGLEGTSQEEIPKCAFLSSQRGSALEW